MEVEIPPNENAAAVVHGVLYTEGGDDIPGAAFAAEENGCGVVEALGVRVRDQI